jgi:hypothetical protein
MTTNDILMILGCLVIGYGLVSLLLRKPEPPPAAPRADAPGERDDVPPSPPAPPPGPPHWASVLELPADASPEQIRDAYRRLISQYHPDKVAALGIELRELADRKSAEITAAYQQALADHR